jgi:uncharacterized protein (DUF305 family)
MKRTTWAVLLLSSALPAQVADTGSEFMRSSMRAMERMDKDMARVTMDGDVDHDFAAMMIPHHGGAIDMAKAELAYGKDPVMRRMAQEILVEQQSEIDAMNLWASKKH